MSESNQGGHQPAHGGAHGIGHHGSAQPLNYQSQGGQRGLPKIAPLPTMKPEEVDLDPIGLVEEAEEADAGESKIKAFGIRGNVGQRSEWKRKPFTTGQGAVRVRSFHGKLSDQGLEYLDQAVNAWLDVHPEVEVKFVTSTVGTFEGKIREPALILNLWY